MDVTEVKIRDSQDCEQQCTRAVIENAKVHEIAWLRQFNCFAKFQMDTEHEPGGLRRLLCDGDGCTRHLRFDERKDEVTIEGAIFDGQTICQDIPDDKTKELSCERGSRTARGESSSENEFRSNFSFVEFKFGMTWRVAVGM